MSTKRTILGLALLIALGTMVLVGQTLLAGPGHENQGNGDQHAHDHESAEDSSPESEDNNPYDVELRTRPSPGKIVPDEDKTELVFTVRKNGTVVEDVQLSYRLYTPPRTFWFGTDFPLVEGSRLLSGTVQVPEGTHVVSMILPIRGTYSLKTTVRGPAGVTHDEQSFSVFENPRDVMNLAIFLFVLFLIGGLAGYFLSGRATASVPSSWVMLGAGILGVSLLLSPTAARAHGEGSWVPHELEENLGVEKIRPEADFTVRTFPSPVIVGEMLSIDYEVTAAKAGETVHPDHDHDHEPRHGVSSNRLVESIFVHSRGGMEMVRQASWFKEGRGSISVQLFEGAPHFLVSRFYRPTERYGPTDHGHDHGDSPFPEHGEESPGEQDHTEDPEKEGDHERASVPWEAEMLHHLPPGDYKVRFEESGDPAMKWLTFPVDVEDPTETASERMADCEDVKPGSTLSTEGGCYNLKLNEDGTTYELAVEDGGGYRLFTQHLPREFDLTLLREGEEIDPIRKFIPNKGEYLGRSVKRVEVEPVSPPFDDIFKILVTFLAVIGLGYYLGSRAPNWIARS